MDDSVPRKFCCRSLFYSRQLIIAGSQTRSGKKIRFFFPSPCNFFFGPERCRVAMARSGPFLAEETPLYGRCLSLNLVRLLAFVKTCPRRFSSFLTSGVAVFLPTAIFRGSRPPDTVFFGWSPFLAPAFFMGLFIFLVHKSTTLRDFWDLPSWNRTVKYTDLFHFHCLHPLAPVTSESPPGGLPHVS